MSLKDHSAAGSAAGFVYQFERALLWLSQCPSGSRVGIETADDVALVTAEGLYLSEQDKHTIANAKPYGDRSRDLWNTMAIWVDALHSGELRAQTAFRLVTNAVLQDCIAKDIGQAASEAQIDACIARLEQAAVHPSETIATLVQAVLDQAVRPSLREVIRHCELLDGATPEGGADMPTLIASNLQMPAALIPQASSIVNELRGWLTSTVLGLWRDQQQGWIERDAFVNYLYSIIEHRKRVRTRERAERLIPVTDADMGEQRGRRFVKQLYLVTDEDAEVNHAIKDFIRCHSEKIRLSREGDVTREDWLDFSDTLSSRWESISRRLLRTRSSATPEDLGYEIYSETTMEYRARLAGSETDQVYLTSGTYHDLADGLTVGWHPDFKKLIES